MANVFFAALRVLTVGCQMGRLAIQKISAVNVISSVCNCNNDLRVCIYFALSCEMVTMTIMMMTMMMI